MAHDGILYVARLGEVSTFAKSAPACAACGVFVENSCYHELKRAFQATMDEHLGRPTAALDRARILRALGCRSDGTPRARTDDGESEPGSQFWPAIRAICDCLRSKAGIQAAFSLGLPSEFASKFKRVQREVDASKRREAVFEELMSVVLERFDMELGRAGSYAALATDSAISVVPEARSAMVLAPGYRGNYNFRRYTSVLLPTTPVWSPLLELPAIIGSVTLAAVAGSKRALQAIELLGPLFLRHPDTGQVRSVGLVPVPGSGRASRMLSVIESRLGEARRIEKTLSMIETKENVMAPTTSEEDDIPF